MRPWAAWPKSYLQGVTTMFANDRNTEICRAPENARLSERTKADDEAEFIVAAFLRIPNQRRTAVLLKVLQLVPYWASKKRVENLRGRWAHWFKEMENRLWPTVTN